MRRFDMPLARLALTLGLPSLIAGCSHLPDAAAPSAATADDPITQVTLERSPCFGACATFTLALKADGQATLSLPSRPGSDATARKVAADTGTASAPLLIHGQIPATDTTALLETLRQGHFDQLRDDYSAQITDMPSTSITVATAHQVKTTRVYAVPCARDARSQERPAGTPAPVPDVFCQAAERMDAMACQLYRDGPLPADRTARFPPHCSTSS